MTPREKALAKNRTLTIIFLLITIGLAMFGIISFLAGQGYSIIVLLVDLFSISIPVAFIIERLRLRRIYCPHCREKFDYETDVGWEVSGVETKGNKSVAIVAIECTCSNCGETPSFTEKFTVGRIDDKGNYHESNINSSVRKFFR